MKQVPSQIFKGEFRGKTPNLGYNCFSVFNYLDYNDSSRAAFGKLVVFNEESIASNKSIQYKLEQNQVVVIVPFLGALDIKSSFINDFVHTHQIISFFVEKDATFSLSNPYLDQNIQFLQLRFLSNFIENQKIDFELNAENSINCILKNDFFAISLAVFDARKEAEYTLNNSTNGVFAFVLNGAFEFQNRLLENRDGLKIWDIPTLEMEALSNEAMIMIVEVKL